jgi:hypothetical protein
MTAADLRRSRAAWDGLAAALRVMREMWDTRGSPFFRHDRLQEKTRALVVLFARPA